MSWDNVLQCPVLSYLSYTLSSTPIMAIAFNRLQGNPCAGRTRHPHAQPARKSVKQPPMSPNEPAWPRSARPSPCFIVAPTVRRATRQLMEWTHTMPLYRGGRSHRELRPARASCSIGAVRVGRRWPEAWVIEARSKIAPLRRSCPHRRIEIIAEIATSAILPIFASIFGLKIRSSAPP